MIIHPLLKLAVSHPHLLGDHVEAYVALAGDELKKVCAGWVVRIGLSAGVGVLVLVGLIWIGVALLLVAAVPSEAHITGWALWLVPLTPFFIATVLAFVARAIAIERPFDVLKRQFKADMAVVREVGVT